MTLSIYKYNRKKKGRYIFQCYIITCGIILKYPYLHRILTFLQIFLDLIVKYKIIF